MESFSGTSDIAENLHKYTSSGKVYIGTKPYITLKEAKDNISGFGNTAKSVLQFGERMNQTADNEMAGFYGTPNSRGETVIFIEPKDEDADPPEKWVPASKKGSKQGIWDHPSMTGSVAGVTTVGTAGAHQMNAAAQVGTFGPEKGGTVLRMPFTSGKGVQFMGTTGINAPGAHQLGKIGGYTGKGAALLPKTASVARVGAYARYAMPVASKVAGVVAFPITAGVALYGGIKRGDALVTAAKTGDYSSLNRPYFEPVWKNKDISDMIKYDNVFEDFTIVERDETAMTITSSWWDKIKEVRDYPKPAQGAGGTADVGTAGDTSQSFGSNEELLAKSSINFSTEETLSGGNMRMQCYHDADIAHHPKQQLDFDFGGTIYIVVSYGFQHQQEFFKQMVMNHKLERNLPQNMKFHLK